ncbi:Zinc/iron permease [Lipomyces tetrasporus]|uniref:Zinc/iron permease n=1 Tax=Lipomyces tetrasporus TaxID=54092 RepID=A0AAD7VT39_9ASCO|nr:Zinc/iron permease [Lipomyces tetrasporus]KAJ8101003.1 Zinc/iron permease [Lipomyces tetrasporus]
MVLSNNERGWLLAVCSGIACVLGSYIICCDLVLRRFKRFENFDIREDKRILVYGFSLSSGVMILTSMYELLPEALENVVNSPSLFDQQTPSGLVVMASYVLGVAIFAVLNLVIHAVSQRSVVHCAHESIDNLHGHSHTHGHSQSHGNDSAGLGLQSHEHSHAHSHSTETQSHEIHNRPIIVANYGSAMSEHSPLMVEITRSLYAEENMDSSETEAQLSRTSSARSSLPEAIRVDFNKFEKDASFSTSSASSTVININDVNGAESTVVAAPVPTTTFADMLSIGLQTSLAISLHKVPEGFITFATSYANPELGLSVFIALAIHNFIEGFTIAFPLYLALGSRWMALGAAFVLGGLSQPAGALIAWLVFRGQQPETEGSIVYGVLFGIVAGFLTIIALQMFATAVNYSRKPNVCINWAFAGIVLVGVAMNLGDV